MEHSGVDFFDQYFDYISPSEAPILFHRWALIASMGAWLGRSVWFPFGSGRLFPTSYTIFVGHPGTRKTTAILRAKRVLSAAGYETFSPQRTSKEKFLIDLAANSWNDTGEDEPDEDMSYYMRKKMRRDRKDAEVDLDILNELKIGSKDGDDDTTPREVFIAADEFNNFIGTGNIEFQSLLGELWDWDDPKKPYRTRNKNSRSIAVFQPTISVLGGTTPSQFAECFPLASIGQGFMSRLLLIHAEPTNTKITFPAPPDEAATDRIVAALHKMRHLCRGEMVFDDSARTACDTIYRSWPELEDSRFKHYSTRRFTHLLKLCMIVTAMRFSIKVTVKDVIYANTILAFAESTMSKAIGELGKAKNAEATNKIMQVLYDAREPKAIADLWKVVQTDLNDPTELGKVLQNLLAADKIQFIKASTGKEGYLPKSVGITRNIPYVDWKLLKGREMK